MANDIETLLTSYERGTLTRRQLLSALAIIAVPACTVAEQQTTAAQQQTTALLRPRTLDHINLAVADVARSEAFYKKLIGLGPGHQIYGGGAPAGSEPISAEYDLPNGDHISISKNTTSGPSYIDHFCVSVDGDFDMAKILKELEPLGLKGHGSVAYPGASSGATLLRDPDNLGVQLVSFSKRVHRPDAAEIRKESVER